MSPHTYGPLEPGGDERVRTADPLLARQVLSQLSYTPSFFSLKSKEIFPLKNHTVPKARKLCLLFSTP